MNHILGIGTDICECRRIGDMIARHGDLFLDRVFTSAEKSYCLPHKASTVHFAGRWAAKEAALKALGTGWARGIGWADLEVCHGPGGRPRLQLHGAAAEVARQLGISEIMISISHTDDLATAFAVAVGHWPADDATERPA